MDVHPPKNGMYRYWSIAIYVIPCNPMWLWGFVWKCISGISWWIIMFFYEIATKSLGVISNFQTQPHAVFNQQVQSFKMLTYPKLPISVDPYPLGTVAFAPLPDFWVPPTRNSWSPTVQTKPGIPFLLKKTPKNPSSSSLIFDGCWSHPMLDGRIPKVHALHSNLSCLNRLSVIGKSFWKSH